MSNSKLQGHSWDIPDELHSHLRRTMNAYRGDKDVVGYQRLKNLIEKPKVSYEQLKRIKNYFDNHTSKTDYMGDKRQDTEFILNGGSKMKHWVNDTLNTAREGIKNPKEIKKDTGMVGNHFIKTHTKDGISTDNVKIKTSHQGSISSNQGIYEIKMMENIINLFNKNKELWQKDK